MATPPVTTDPVCAAKPALAAAPGPILTPPHNMGLLMLARQ